MIDREFINAQQYNLRDKHTLIKVRKKWRPRRHSPNQPRTQESKGRGWREGRGRKELTASWKKISRAWAIGSTEAMRKVGRGR